VVFRRRYFTSRPALQRALAGFMRYYNHNPPTKATASAVVPRPRSSGAGPRRSDLPSGTAKVSTPFRVWTRQGQRTRRL
jgi:hypothetical protein